jgi:hypothetical protein
LVHRSGEAESKTVELKLATSKPAG